MAQQLVNIGTAGNDKTGDPLRTGGSKINSNFTELYNGRVYVLKHSAVPQTVGAVTTEATLATIPIPAGAMGANGRLRIMLGWSMTNNANSKTMRSYLGGTGGFKFFEVSQTTNVTSRHNMEVRNRNSLASQIAAQLSAINGNSTTAFQVGAINTGVAQDIVITGQKAVAADTLTLEWYEIEVFYGA